MKSSVPLTSGKPQIGLYAISGNVATPEALTKAEVPDIYHTTRLLSIPNYQLFEWRQEARKTLSSPYPRSGHSRKVSPS